MHDKHLYIIAGCNGAGKTTASFTIMPDIINCREFVNADEIARGISPFQPAKVAFEAGRIMLYRIQELLNQNESFAFETTLSTRSYTHTILQAKAQGYTTTLLFLWLQSIDLAKERVRTRVAEGGHNIEPDVIERRYTKGIKNLFNLYLPIVDNTFIYDNSKGSYDLMARKVTNNYFDVISNEKYNELKVIMTDYEKQIELSDKIQQALSTVYAKVVEFKKQKGTDIVIMQDGKIVHIKPE